MDKQIYANMCKRASVKQGDRPYTKDIDWHDNDLVVLGGVKYVPGRYILGFDATGSAIHQAELKDITAHSVVIADLDGVGEV